MTLGCVDLCLTFPILGLILETVSLLVSRKYIRAMRLHRPQIESTARPAHGTACHGYRKLLEVSPVAKRGDDGRVIRALTQESLFQAIIVFNLHSGSRFLPCLKRRRRRFGPCPIAMFQSRNVGGSTTSWAAVWRNQLV